MNDIVGILDMDGFTINKKFKCRELGIINTHKETARSYRFDIGILWTDLSVKDAESCWYVVRRIIKMPLIARPGSLPLTDLSTIVNDFYAKNKKTERSVMAYKGGHVEKDLLHQLNIPSMNLESMGSPKAIRLFGKLPWIETCGKHFGVDQYEHCAKVEVEAYAMWFRENKDKWTVIEHID